MRTIVVVGAGTMGRTHIKAYQSMEQVHLKAVVELDREKAMRAAGEDTAIYPTLEEAVQAEGHFDIIDVCLPTYLHEVFVKKAADFGAHVICEKPLALQAQVAKELIAYCESRQVKLFVGHVVRFFPEYQQAKRLIGEAAHEQVGVVHTSRRSSHPKGWDGWYTDSEKSGGVTLDLIIHDLDFLRWCFGEVERVYAKRALQENDGRKEYVLATLRFRSGMIAHVEGSWAHQSFQYSFEIARDTGILTFDSMKAKPVQLTKNKETVLGNGVHVPASPLQESPYKRELKHFLDCIESGAAPLVTAEDAWQAVRLSNAVTKSMMSGKPVLLNDV